MHVGVRLVEELGDVLDGHEGMFGVCGISVLKPECLNYLGGILFAVLHCKRT